MDRPDGAEPQLEFWVRAVIEDVIEGWMAELRDDLPVLKVHLAFHQMTTEIHA